jgi:hypothetical protein
MKNSPERLIAIEICKAIKSNGAIDHDDVVSYLERVDGSYVTESRTGRFAKIDPIILREIRKVGGDRIVWCRRSLLWRLRQDGDDPGRTQDE